MHYVNRVGLDYVKKKILEDHEGRKALWERLQFSLDGEPDPWFEFDKASVDTRQFAQAGRRGAAKHEDETTGKSICRVDDIPVLGSRRVARPEGMDVAVFRNDEDQVFALLDRCPHKGGPLSQGIVFGTSVACPLHNWTIGLDDGCAQGARRRLHAALRVQGRGRPGACWTPVELATLALDLAPPRAGPGATTGALGDASFDVQAPHGG